MEKEYTSVRKRLQILRSRGMDIPTSSEKQRKIIKNYNYYNLINAYKKPFLEDLGNYPVGANRNEDYYISGTKPEFLECLYKFDENLRLIFLKNILQIEEKIKDALVQAFYEHHINHISRNQKEILHRESEYLRRNYYDLNDKEISTIIYKSGYRENIAGRRVQHRPSIHRIKPKSKTISNSSIYDDSISIIYKSIGRQRKKKQFIKDYLDKHTYIPMWVLTNILTFGNVSKLFQIQQVGVKELIYKKLKLRDSEISPTNDDLIDLANLIQILGLYRNICAHNERFYCTKVNIVVSDNFLKYLSRFPEGSVVLSHKQNRTTLPRNSYENLKRRRESLFTLMFAISVFLDNFELKKFKSEINKEIQKLNGTLPLRSYNTVLREMGLDFNWQQYL
ncbi:Abortive infection bacteriophage resistance protein [Streptococcus suis]|uniref:Abortive infection bacteriophage resistance protein n=1 Tax=Streptococcus suis TaxID=1307 RepID=A0A0Z8FPG0_STRSU|nr:Abi family protein [Streptococcus suis]NQH35790.1 Abi family protein [Streptococcus suis]NQN54230.1 Abi family protein [Streptococcus suis]CYU84093.1 Abortive infection bacteriophage resistance protein [Streptococcus suis]